MDKIGRKQTTIITMSITPFGAFLISFSGGNVVSLLIGLCILFPFSITLQICVDTWAQDMLPQNEKGKFLGIINIGKAFGQDWHDSKFWVYLE